MSLRRRVAQVPATARRAVRHPRWLAETIRMSRYRRAQLRRPFSLARWREHFAPLDEAVAAVAGVSREEAAAALAAAPREGGASELGARTELIQIVGALVRLLRPTVMVETGVAEGLTTTAALAAMAANRHGRLYSVDLPPLQRREEEFVGRAVPADLRDRWDLTLGPSRLVLPRLVARVAPLDIFLHDADHTYPSQMNEYRTAWPHLRRGGVLVSDDVANAAFLDFAADVGARPYLVGHAESSNALGLLRKD